MKRMHWCFLSNISENFLPIFIKLSIKTWNQKLISRTWSKLRVWGLEVITQNASCCIKTSECVCSGILIAMAFFFNGMGVLQRTIKALKSSLLDDIDFVNTCNHVYWSSFLMKINYRRCVYISVECKNYVRTHLGSIKGGEIISYLLTGLSCL